MIEVDAAGKRAVLRDLNSLNGCFVNNVRIKGQREALSHGDNVRFGFDTRIWTVDCGSEKTRQRKSSSGDWEFGCGGAAQSHAHGADRSRWVQCTACTTETAAPCVPQAPPPRASARSWAR